MEIKEKRLKDLIVPHIINKFPEQGKISSVDWACINGFPIEFSFNNKSKKATRELLKYCKAGYIIQYLVGNSADYNLPPYTIYYMRKDCDLAKHILETRKLKGYRII